MATSVDGSSLVRQAIDKGELGKLLLGKPEYQYLPKYTSSPEDTDLAALLDIYYSLDEEYSREYLRKRLQDAILEVLECYEGLMAAAYCIVFEVVVSQDRRLGLDLGGIADLLRVGIIGNTTRLTNDWSGGGWQCPDGRLGDLRRLSRITVERGGPAFCD